MILKTSILENFHMDLLVRGWGCPTEIDSAPWQWRTEVEQWELYRVRNHAAVSQLNTENGVVRCKVQWPIWN